ncbi:hypothetical protein CATRI_06875 [Corynebacterium atrinae]|uniref:DUF1269 domain-containing protein n=1 Tax=Corynebacterium atrinae TaxID=1336740 RepID=UPI0025B61A14|nr:DUF1269 domain-containing protein [Corynebacterium atrinae]WJY63456.1 hypothetical protein CATRI_06875 [Corynebacterium atrinae]
MTDYAVAITLPDNASTYELYSKLKPYYEQLGVSAAAIVERDDQGAIRLTEGDDTLTGEGTLTGTLLGMLVGVLGGPLGMLLGASVGASGGLIFDAARANTADDAITEFAGLVPTGRNAIIAETAENDTTALDAVVKEAGGTIIRRPVAEIVAEIEAQQQAVADAADAARHAMREQRKQERHEKVEERVDALKAKFSRLK